MNCSILNPPAQPGNTIERKNLHYKLYNTLYFAVKCNVRITCIRSVLTSPPSIDGTAFNSAAKILFSPRGTARIGKKQHEKITTNLNVSNVTNHMFFIWAKRYDKNTKCG